MRETHLASSLPPRPRLLCSRAPGPPSLPSASRPIVPFSAAPRPCPPLPPAGLTAAAPQARRRRCNVAKRKVEGPPPHKKQSHQVRHQDRNMVLLNSNFTLLTGRNKNVVTEAFRKDDYSYARFFLARKLNDYIECHDEIEKAFPRGGCHRIS